MVKSQTWWRFPNPNPTFKAAITMKARRGILQEQQASQWAGFWQLRTALPQGGPWEKLFSTALCAGQPSVASADTGEDNLREESCRVAPGWRGYLVAAWPRWGSIMVGRLRAALLCTSAALWGRERRKESSRGKTHRGMSLFTHLNIPPTPERRLPSRD